MSEVLKRISNLSPQKRQLLLKQMRQVRPEPAFLPIPREPRGEPLPLSFAQQRLWFLEQLQPARAAYNLATILELYGHLDATALARSLAEVVRRHESLRTTFAMAGDRPVQLVHPWAEKPLPRIDLSALPEAARRRTGWKALEGQVHEPFDLVRGPLLRAVLLRLAPEEHVFAVVLHHIVSDGWSTGVLKREIGSLYQAFSRGDGSPLPEPPVQYADFAVWQRGWLSGPELDRQLGYWRRRLADSPTVLELPVDRPRPREQSHRGAEARRLFAPSLPAALRVLGRAAGATLFNLLLGGFQSLVARYTGCEDIAVGSPVANRNRPELEGLIGFFANTLVLRTDLSGDPDVHALLARVREVTTGAFEHQDLPFERLVDELQPERSLSHSPFFQVMLTLLNTPQEPPPRLPELTWKLAEVQTRAARFDLTLSFFETAAGLLASAEYDTDLFDAVRIDRLLGHLETLLAGAAADPGCGLSDLPLLAESERHQLLIDWNDTAAPPPEGSLQGWIESQVERTPDAVAAACDGKLLTYRGLDRWCNRLAHRLRLLGVGPEVTVGVCAERSLEMVGGLLAVLKAGGAYMPLDPDYPPERLGWMLASSRPAVLLAQERLLPVLPETAAPVVLLDREDRSALPAERPAVSLPPDCTAYVIYTSGSTGRPKGAVNSHRGVVNRLLWAQKRFALTTADRVLQKAPFSFDVSVWELFWPLVAGARLVLARPDGHRDPAYLVRLMAEAEITIAHFVPSMLQAFLEAEGIESCARLRRVLASGEALPRELERRFGERLGSRGVTLHNLYGPTEAAIEVTAWNCLEMEELRTVPIGRPAANTRLYLVDRQMQLVPIGVPGELCIGGVQLARGYQSQPELTAERFLPDPFGEPGDRLYRTGDLARTLPSGTIEFLGRIDHQVKIRGFRIELGEVEHALAGCAGVKQAAVAVRAGAAGGDRLVAYIVPAASGSAGAPAAAELRAQLARCLPEYMIPTAIVTLAALPLSPSGKVDRRALPEPGGSPAAPGRPDATPATRAERLLAGIWEQVLRLDRVGVRDNFFELGGDSILSIQIVSRAARAGLRITPKQIFQHQTVAELAAVASFAPGPEAGADEPEGEVPLTPVQRWFLESEPADPHWFNQALLLKLLRPVPAAVLDAALRQVSSHHAALRLRFTRDASGWRQRHAPVAQAAVADLDLTALTRELRAAALSGAAADLQASLDLGRGPLLRAARFRLAHSDERLLLVLHHLIVDGVSWRILLEDLEHAVGYPAEPGGGLPGRTTSFARWSERLVEQALRGAAEEELAAWLDARRHDAAPLPLDEPAVADYVGTTETFSIRLSCEDTEALLVGLPRLFRAGLDDALLTALAEVLADASRSRRVLLDLEGHGREEADAAIDLSRTIGWFTAIYPVLLAVPVEGGLAGRLRAVKEQLRAVPRRGVGYGALRYLAGSEVAQRLRALPQPDVLFNYLGQLDRALPTSKLFTAAAEPAGPSISPRQKRRHALEVTGRVAAGQLRVDWVYGPRHQRTTIERLTERFGRTLRALAELCRTTAGHGYTPSDFPLARLAQETLDRLAERGEIEDIYPLGPTQLGMLFLHLYAPGSPAYFQQLTWTLRGGVDTAALRAAWERLVERHAALRTAFAVEGLPEPLQLVRRRTELPWSELDWRGVAALEAQRRIGALMLEERGLGFDLSLAPVLRLVLVRLSDDVYQLIWSYHHILFDGWCLPLLTRELLAFYESARGGEEPQLDPVRPYRDYLAWLRGRDLAAAEAFWRRELAGFALPTRLGIDRAPGALPSSRGDHDGRRIHLPHGELAALQAFAQAHQLTLNTLAQGAWAVLLDRYGGANDVVFGVTSSGRPAELPGVESIVGLFITTLPLRVRLAPEARLVPWLRLIQERQLEQRQYEYAPLVQVQSWSDVPGDLPLFETFLIFQNLPLGGAPAGGGSLEVRQAGAFERTSYPLALFVLPFGELSLAVSFDRERFEAIDVERLLGHLAQVLMAIVEDPSRRLHDLPLLSAAERHQLLIEWNDSFAVHPEGVAVQDLIGARAAQSPSAVAARCAGRELLYGELAARMNLGGDRLAARVARGAVVAILAERGLDFLSAVLAVFRAGAAYLPLDPAHPTSRIATVLADSGAAAVLVSATLAETAAAALAEVPSAQQPHLVELGALFVSDGDGPIAAARPAAPDDLAYVIYTSGSTGVPKGVMVTHAGMLNHLFAKLDDLGITSGDTVAQNASQCFDISVWQLLCALLVGGRVEIVPDDVALDPLRLLACVEDARVTILETVPSILRILLDEVEHSREAPPLQRLRWLIPTGEALPPELCRRWLAAYPQVRLMNAYGPTECSDDVAHHALAEPPAARILQMPIGRPVANTRLYVVDGDLTLVPPRVPGELLVGGTGVGRGYLGDPARTAELFVPDLFGRTPGDRLYHTGDRARHLSDGSLEFLGRVDRQVKLRGLRLELGEIEAVLARHPGVRQAVAGVARGERLVVWAVALPEVGISAPALQEFLRGELPAGMVPTEVVLLDRLPLTPNGKVDRRALPLPESVGDTGAGEATPVSPTEELLASIWSEVLGVESVEVVDNFFELGGHSLTAIQVVSRIRQAFNVEVALRTLFERPTVAALAEAVAAARSERGPGEASPIVPVAREGALPLSFSQQRLWFLDQLAPGTTEFNIPTGTLLGAGIDPRLLRQAFAEVVRRHEALRTTFGATAGEPYQVISRPAPFLQPVVALSALPTEAGAAEARRLAEQQHSFDLSRGPLLRARLLELPGCHLLLVAVHHIVADGWSLNILLRELTALYQAFDAGLPSPLPELPVQYADYACWQRRWLRGPVLEGEVAYWRHQLAGAPPLLALPIDRLRSARQTHRGARHRLEIPAELAARLRRWSRQQGATPFMTLLAALAAVLQRQTAMDDIPIGTYTANRDRLEIERLVGFFVNTLVLRLAVAGEQGFGELLRQAREVTLGAHAHQDLPFEKLLEELRPPRTLSHTPLFQVMLELQNLAPASLAIGGVLPLTAAGAFDQALRREELGRAHFDLSLKATLRGDELRLNISYNRDLFDRATIARLGGHFLQLLDRALAEPRRPLGELPAMSAAELHQVACEWGRGPATPADGEPVHRRIAAQAATAPHAVAVIVGEHCLSYGELERAAGRLARALRALGTGTGEPVGLCAERSSEMLIGMLGILQAGAAYVPLDPVYPHERLAFMVEASGVRFVVAARRSADRLPVGPRRLLLEEVVHAKAPTLDAADLALEVDAEHLAYLIFTSGSTGQPKPVAVGHGSLARYVAFAGAELGLRPGDRVLQFASLNFDTAAEEIFSCLARGATLVLRSDRMLASPAEFLDRCSELEITVLDLPTAWWSELASVAAGEAAVPPALRAVIIGGEQAPSERVSAWLGSAGREVRLLNTYGPTEATIVATWCELREGVAGALHRVPIGSPVPGVRLAIAGADGLPVPMGAAGELLIGGAGLARGYFGRPDLTAERFIPDPHGEEPSARFYRSGDLVRFRCDGRLEFLGRVDRQVKVRGFRVEPEEIEAALSRHPALQAAAVAPWPDPAGGVRLVAYLVPAAGREAPAASALRSFLKERLPEPMLPASFTVLDRLPVTRSGKVDRHALPAPEASRASLSSEVVPPSTPIEEALAAIWREVLGITEIGIQDNFFELGGHSLLATQVLARIRSRMHVNLPLIALFEMPTIEELALAFEEALLDRIEALGEGASLAALLPGAATE